jgi:hypothetical protein
MPRKSNKIYGNYSHENISKAVQAVKGGMSYRKACSTFGVPKTTVLDRVKGNVKDNGAGIKAGRKPCIPLSIEKKIAEAFVKAADTGFGISKQQLLMKVSRMAKALGIKAFKNGIPGED